MGKTDVQEHLNRMDPQSTACLAQIVQQDAVFANRISDVRFVLVVLSSRGIVYDLEALRQKIMLSYPDAAVFFQTTYGQPVGLEIPRKVDLLIDFTGPGQRQGWFYARKLRRMARFAVGRNSGLFRKKIYDRVFDEKSTQPGLPTEMLEKERFVQKKVLALAGVPFSHISAASPDRGKSIALELPGYQRL